MKYLNILLFLLFASTNAIYSQDTIATNDTLTIRAQDYKQSDSEYQSDPISIGIGAGLDYGGIGFNALIYPNPHLGVFVGTGHAFAGIGFNAGIKLRTLSNTSKVTPYFLAMYGYNSSVYISGTGTISKLFYGPSLGLGIDLKQTPSLRKKGYFTCAVLVPIRGNKPYQYIDEIAELYGIPKQKFFPVTISIAYRIPKY